MATVSIPGFPTLKVDVPDAPAAPAPDPMLFTPAQAAAARPVSHDLNLFRQAMRGSRGEAAQAVQAAILAPKPGEMASAPVAEDTGEGKKKLLIGGAIVLALAGAYYFLKH